MKTTMGTSKNIMMVVTAFLLACLTTVLSHADEEVCGNLVSCPCGNKGENVTICADVDTEVCTRLSKCKTCEERSDICSECPEGFEGPLCSQAVIKTCENPGPLSNGKIMFSLPDDTEGSKMKSLPVNTVIEYFCNEGYRLEGSQYLTCNPTGLWSAEVPTCVETLPKKCENPGPISKGKLRFSHPTINVGEEMELFPLGTVLHHSCSEGYHLLGSASQTCKTCPTCKTGFWEGQGPKCKINCGRGFYNYGPCQLMKCKSHAPWVVSISVENNDGHSCLGVLLNHQTVLTAAHCLVGNSTFIVHFGKHRSKNREDSQVMVRRSSRVLLNPYFSKTTFDANIGLLFFQPKIRFTADVQPICLPGTYDIHLTTPIGKTGIISTTRGNKNAFSTGDMILRRMTVLSDESCLESNKQADLFITGNSFCAGNKENLQAVSEEDSGAPLFFYESWNGIFKLQGIVNFPINSEQGNYAIFTELPSNFLLWILENME